ncbi:MAG: hypothetical protein IJH14_04445 [Solobacterium sp.]|nr:hypothetical protein [Solobacterium sp.]
MMFVYHTENEKGEGCLLNKSRVTMKILGFSVLLFVQDEEWFLRLPHPLKADRRNPMPENTAVRISCLEQGTYADLYFIRQLSKFNEYVRYQYPSQPFTIGSSLQDDICFDLPLVLAAAFTIDPLRHVIRKNRGLAAADLNGKIIKNEAVFQSGDVFSFFCLRIVFHQDFLMIGGLLPLRDTMIRYARKTASATLPEIPVLQYHYDAPAPCRLETDCRLKVPQINDDGIVSSVLLSMAPALMMASASLTAGSLNAYRSYLAGRSFIEILPSVLLPGVMLLSALLWNPLQRRYEKKQKRIRREKIVSEFRNEAEEWIRDTEQLISLYNSYIQAVTLTPAVCTEAYMRTHTFYCHHDKDVLLYFGMAAGRLKINFENPLSCREEDVRNIIDRIHKASEQTPEAAAVYSVSDYQRIVVEGTYHTLLHLAACTVAYLYPSVNLCFLCPEEILRKNMWIYEAVSIGHDGSRLLFLRPEELQEYLDELPDTGEDLIVFSIASPFDMKSVCDIPVLCFETEKGRHPCDLRVLADGARLQIMDQIHHETYTSTIDDHYEETLLYRIGRKDRADPVSLRGSGGFLAMLKATVPQDLKIAERWQMNEEHDDLKCVIGMAENGRQIILDLDENGQGPHGLIAGTTGSGKSELLLSMILSLAVRYSPERLQFVIIDFKGGSTFQSISQDELSLPHLTAMLSDLDADDMQRALFCLKDLLRQRELAFRTLSSIHQIPIRNLKDYRRNLREDDPLEKLADIILIVDEFAELKRERPDFLIELVRIARLGRSLGLHLILATQKPGGIVTDQIWSNTRFKICLKVSEKQDSAEMIHCADALYLKDPGSFILYADERMQKGRCGYLHQKSDRQKNPVSILDERGRIIQTAGTEGSVSETEFMAVMKEIVSLGGGPKKNLWLKILPDLNVRDETWEKGLFALLDDYEAQRYGTVRPLDEIPAAHAVLSSDPSETHSFLDGLIYALISVRKAEDEYYLIDDQKRYENTGLQESGMFNSCMKTVEEEKLENLFRRLKQEDGIRRVLIITDIAHLFQNGEKYRQDIRTLLEGSSRFQLDLWLIMRTSSALNYREQTLITDFYCLKNENQNEIQTFLQTPFKGHMHKTSHGLYRKDRMLEFAWFQCDETEIHDLCSAYHRDSRLYRIPCMKESLSPEEYSGEGIPLGMLYGNYQWYTIGRQLVVCALYEEEWQKLQAYLSDTDTVFITYDAFQKMDSAALRAYDVILLKEAAEEYCRYQHQKRMPKEGEGLLIRSGRKEVIHFVCF